MLGSCYSFCADSVRSERVQVSQEYVEWERDCDDTARWFFSEVKQQAGAAREVTKAVGRRYTRVTQDLCSRLSADEPAAAPE